MSTFQYESVGHGYVAGASTTGSDTAEAHTLFAKTAFGSAEALVLCNNTTDGTFETHKAVISTVPTGSGGSAAVVSVYGQVRTDATAAFCTFAAQGVWRQHTTSNHARRRVVRRIRLRWHGRA